MNELPAITGSTYASAAVNMAALNMPPNATQLFGQAAQVNDVAAQFRRVATPTVSSPQPAKQEKPIMGTRRLVQVLIADPNENIPLEDSLLYSGEQKLTDATDQELFFEIDIKNLLDKHNEKRVKVVDKKVKERTEHLEPAKIRDLKMVVVTVAQF